MPSILLSGPAAEPITLAQAKQYLRVEHDDDDDIIPALIRGARLHVETQTRRALITQSWRLVRDVWPDSGFVAVLPVPLIALDAARIHRADGTTLAIGTGSFVVDRVTAPARLAFTRGALPVPERYVSGIEIDVTCGYGDEPDDVPEPLRQAIRMLLAHWYENRGIIGESHFVALPQTAAALIAPYRVLAL
jgi:uncharacterized phiE125 gp8 family phage protein